MPLSLKIKRHNRMNKESQEDMALRANEIFIKIRCTCFSPTFPTRSLPDVRIFYALHVYFVCVRGFYVCVCVCVEGGGNALDFNPW